MREVAPCRDCMDRKVGCHSACDRYKGFKDRLENQKGNERIFKERSKQQRDYIRSRCEYYRKKNK